MPIQILPARLANQIAAGEVVERPASVVKELVENSLDAGASAIDIDIEKGGHKRILIRDNGCGIPQHELALALSRHATSKISSLEDLEHIASLGFRGEALASISSVARLSLSSKPAEQADGWQAQCEGRDMQVTVQPVAHPDGSSVDVLDLFFNTPARRKFLKAEKTEFQHIDEIVRRIALSRFDVAFSLRHNGKLIRKYPAASNDVSKVRRLTAICGNEFADNAIALNSQYQDFSLQGWLASPQNAKAQADCQYFYVNGRMMRDKLLNHAVRQAFEGVIAAEHQLSYVLYFTLDNSQVDVNVHPAKHEVRFHQSRLVHDFIYRALTDALNQYFSGAQSGEAAGQQLPAVEPNHDYIRPLSRAVDDELDYQAAQTQSRSGGQHGAASTSSAAGRSSSSFSTAGVTPHIAEAAHHYQQLMRAPGDVSVAQLPEFIRVNPRHVLVAYQQQFYLLPIIQLLSQQWLRKFSPTMPVMQPLLLPVSLAADATLLARAEALQSLLLELSIDIAVQGKRIILRKIPAGLRQFNWTQVLEQLLLSDTHDADELQHCLAAVLAEQQSEVSQLQLQQLWGEYCANLSASLANQLAQDGTQVPLNQWLQNYV